MFVKSVLIMAEEIWKFPVETEFVEIAVAVTWSAVAIALETEFA